MKELKSVIDETMITEWKAKFKKIYKTTIDNEQYIWRKIKRSEYSEIMSNKLEENEDKQYYKRQDEITKIVVLYPENIQEILEDNAGISAIISGEVLDKSGFNMKETEEI